MKTTERKKLKDIHFAYTLTSMSTDSHIDNGEWHPTKADVRIIGTDLSDEDPVFAPTPVTVGKADIMLIDIDQIEKNFCLWEELDQCSKSTSRIGELICGELDGDETPISCKFCKKLNKAFGTWIEPWDIHRIVYVNRCTTKKKYRGNNISSLFYEDLFRVFNPDVILTYPFPLQFEGTNTLKPTGGEFKLNFAESMKKLKAVYRKAGMHSIDRNWMAMMNRRF